MTATPRPTYNFFMRPIKMALAVATGAVILVMVLDITVDVRRRRALEGTVDAFLSGANGTGVVGRNCQWKAGETPNPRRTRCFQNNDFKNSVACEVGTVVCDRYYDDGTSVTQIIDGAPIQKEISCVPEIILGYSAQRCYEKYMAEERKKIQHPLPAQSENDTAK